MRRQIKKIICFLFSIKPIFYNLYIHFRISPNARPAVYCTSLREGTYEDWQFLWNQYEKTDFASEKVVILNALGCTRNTTTLNK